MIVQQVSYECDAPGCTNPGIVYKSAVHGEFLRPSAPMGWVNMGDCGLFCERCARKARIIFKKFLQV